MKHHFAVAHHHHHKIDVDVGDLAKTTVVISSG